MRRIVTGHTAVMRHGRTWENVRVRETLIDFIRHGEPVGGRRYRGSGADDPLSGLGWQQMWRTIGDGCPWASIVTSPLQRCCAFAQALAERNGTTLTVERRFQEVGMGVWEGKTPEQVRAEDSVAYARYYRDAIHGRPPGSEELKDFLERVSNGYGQLITEHSGQHILVVAHAGVMRAMLGHVLKSDPNAWYRAQVDYAGCSRFGHDAHGSYLVFHNRTTLA